MYDIDIDAELAEFEAEWQEPEVETAEGLESEQGSEGQESVEANSDEVPGEGQVNSQNPNDPDADKRNRAFADMRRDLQEAQRYAEFVKKLAQDGGVDPEDILNRYQERNLQAQAEEAEVPFEFYKTQVETQNELSALKESLRAERMDTQIDAVRDKYGADDDSIRQTFEEMFRAGLDPRVQDVDFERFYRSINLDSIIQKEVANATQKALENKQARQQQASIGNGTGVSPTSGNEWSEDEFEAELKRMDIRFR